MRYLKKALCLMMACFLCAVPAQAEAARQGTYTETALTLPADLDKEARIQSLSVHGDRMDLFSEVQTIDNKFVTRHFRSDDGGKTWKEQDASWMTTIGGDPSRQPWTGVRRDGTAYAMVLNSEALELPNLHTGYVTAIIAAHKDGKTRTVCKLEDPESFGYMLAGCCLSNDGDIVVDQEGNQYVEKYLGKPAVSKYLIIDPETGKIKNAVASTERRPASLEYSNGTLLKGGGKQLRVLDAATGTVKQTMDYPGGDATQGLSCINGVFYSLTLDGLYQFKPGEAWIKIMDKSILKEGTAGSNMTSCGALVAEENGVITILMNHDYCEGLREERVGRTLMRYTPAA